MAANNWALRVLKRENKDSLIESPTGHRGEEWRSRRGCSQERRGGSLRRILALSRFLAGTAHPSTTYQEKLFDMDSASKRLEKQVGEAIREIAVLNERVGGLEQMFSTLKDFMEEIKEALALREEKGKSPRPLVQSLNKTSPVQMANALGSGGGAHYRGDADTGRSAMQVSRGTCVPKTVSKPKKMGGTSGNASVSVKNSTVANDVEGVAATFKFLGKIGSKEVIVKIGSGASHNFISKVVVDELKLPVERTRSFQLNFGFGPKAKGAEVCNDVVVEAQGIEIVASFFPTNLGLADVMLGMEWFDSVGTVSIQGRPKTMTFDWHGRTVTLVSDPSLTQGLELGLVTLEWDEED